MSYRKTVLHMTRGLKVVSKENQLKMYRSWETSVGKYQVIQLFFPSRFLHAFNKPGAGTIELCTVHICREKEISAEEQHPKSYNSLKKKSKNRSSIQRQVKSERVLNELQPDQPNAELLLSDQQADELVERILKGFKEHSDLEAFHITVSTKKESTKC